MKVDFRVYLITDRRQAPGGDIARAVAGALDGGIRAVQLREKDLPGGELFRLAGRMRDLTARYGARLLVNDRVDVALAVGADGVHLGGASIPASVARGADFVTFGPVYPTPSKAAYGPPVGLSALAAACREAAVPVFALGGVKAENAGEVIGAGAFGIALISGIVAAADPRGAAAELVARCEKPVAAGKAGDEEAKEGEP